ncbi:MAG TPA: SDR family NAD(P)-dependent oxidoreductase [Puia sp.]|nr:SDR family NAD(P)-dependent oxidoreductase [Puia sp.]
MEKKVWYVAGASKGLGLALTHKLLTQGYYVAATSRLLSSLAEATGGNTLKHFLPLEVDLADEASISGSIRTTWESFGRIDVVVNNAGLSAGVYTVIPAATPWLRRQGYGHVIDIAPMANPTANDDTLIRHTTVALGSFRTRFFNGEVHTPNALYVSIDGRQLADPKKAAAALIRLPAMHQPPALLVLDSDAYRRSTAKMVELDKQLERQGLPATGRPHLGSRQHCRAGRIS